MAWSVPSHYLNQCWYYYTLWTILHAWYGALAGNLWNGSLETATEGLFRGERDVSFQLLMIRLVCMLVLYYYYCSKHQPNTHSQFLKKLVTFTLKRSSGGQISWDMYTALLCNIHNNFLAYRESFTAACYKRSLFTDNTFKWVTWQHNH